MDFTCLLSSVKTGRLVQNSSESVRFSRFCLKRVGVRSKLLLEGGGGEGVVDGVGGSNERCFKLGGGGAWSLRNLSKNY